MKKKNGFTLIELLIVITIGSLISLAVYSMFSSAVDLMRRISITTIDEDIGIFLEKIDREISNQVPFAGIPFEGHENRMAFVGPIVPSSIAPLNWGVGRIRYFYDSSNQSFDRLEETMSQVYKEEADEDHAMPLLKGVEDLQLQYLAYNKAEKQYSWADEWDPAEKENELPVAIRFKLTCSRGDERRAFERTIMVPVAESTR